MDYKNVLVLCIDRDGDLETKTKVRGPIIGREEVLGAATKLGLADPSESDTNVLFAGVKIFDQLKDKYQGVGLVALTGSPNVGFESDEIISKQLDEIVDDSTYDGVVMVSDGAEDDHVLPIVESRLKIISINRVVVKQSEALESTYYILLDFLKEVSSDPKLARLVLGVPGIALILFMFMGPNAWRVILGVVGILFVIKGFNLEGPLDRNITELKKNLVTDKASFFTYIIAALVALSGLIIGYQESRLEPVYIKAIASFISESKDLLVAAGLLALAGRSIDAVIEGRGLRKYLILSTFAISLWFIIGSISDFVVGQILMQELVVSATIGAGLSLTAFLLGRAVSNKK